MFSFEIDFFLKLVTKTYSTRL